MLPIRTFAFALLPLWALTACGETPGMEATSDAALEAAPYPEILPQHALPKTSPARLTENSEAELEARGARLQNRASNL
ncbi:hypothetical protein [Shimia sagamensis]|uniref:Uncharacterized protein n=1 Tax=Shimia sagamensis TaxID=1566352 RepID=A0ABY1PK53_9RHOB|nr:hypothetical protein [Shimia sagamensis]SMP35996.1 hypothetical protein SAMN06265373_11315 [Shimia sagamensis]